MRDCHEVRAQVTRECGDDHPGKDLSRNGVEESFLALDVVVEGLRVYPKPACDRAQAHGFDTLGIDDLDSGLHDRIPG
ncbi:hypothetical protein GCM10011400_14910 [Paraburkholderia caffeinilytica]|uniref:Uncharacterized protein n=1 Tax=Paraburkholderia caffeinilytica TaxID=1761016 RepID=A0ABQ1LWF1_9BURK|nr:hypothetical protein GCM10011400_14910 [Paraburkholderia caffeinilytica]